LTPATKRADIESLFERYGSRYRIFAVATIGFGAISTVLASTSVNVAIPKIMGVFGIGQDVAQWLSAGYLAAATVTMLITAWLTESFGVRNTFVGASVAFIASSLLGALSPNTDVLILARVLQGAASGIFMPLSMSVMSRLFPLEKQGLAMGIFGIIVVMAPALGPYTGGVLVDAFNWRYVFYLSLPMAIIALPMALLFLPERESDGPRPKLDGLGLLLLSGFITLLLQGLSKGQKEGWSSNYILICFLLVFASGVGFIYRQLRTSSPLLNLELFRYANFNASAIIAVIFGAGLYSSLYLTPLFLQTIQGLDATASGFILLPGGLLLAVVFPISGGLSDRLDPWILICMGLIMFALSSWLMIASDRHTSAGQFIYWVILGRVGMGLIMPSLNVATFSALPPHLLTQASGTANFLRQLGGAFGVNLSSIFLERQSSQHLSRINDTQHAGNIETQETVAALLPNLVQAGIDQSQQQAVAVWVLGRELYQQALTLAFQDTFGITAIVFLAALLPTAYLAFSRKH